MVLLPGDRTFGLLGLARRYLRAYRMVNFHLEKKKKAKRKRTSSQISCLSFVGAVIFISLWGVETTTLY